MMKCCKEAGVGALCVVFGIAGTMVKKLVQACAISFLLQLRLEERGKKHVAE